MLFNQIVSLSLLISSVAASLCSDPANFPSYLQIGLKVPFVTSSYISADGLLSTSVTGNMLVKSNCSLQFVDLTLRNAPASANILFYAGSFPVSSTGMSGEIVNGVSPEIVFYDQSQFVVSSSLPGVSWSDFTSISIYAKSSKWVIGSADFSGLVTASPTGASPTGTETANPLTAKSASSSLTTNLGIAVVMGIIIYRLRV